MTGSLAFVNGLVWTGDPARPRASALAVQDGVVAAVGDEAIARASEGEVVDLVGGTLLSGFGDGHAHPVLGGLEELFAPVRGLSSVPEIVGAVAAHAAGHPQDSWILGFGYDPTLAAGGRFEAGWLDAAVRDRPVALRAADYHTLWCNSAALQAAGISAHTPDPPDGEIVRDDGGTPLGTLREWGATRYVDDVVPPVTGEERVDALARACRRYRAAGITWVQDAWVEPGDIEVYLAALRRDLLGVRANLALLAEPGTWAQRLTDFQALRMRVAAAGGDRLTANTVKFFADGIIEAGTAALLEPYHDCPIRHGVPNWDWAALAEAVTAFDDAGFQVHIHAIGDAGVRAALDAVHHATQINGPRDRRPVIAHNQLVDPADVARFAELGVIANFEPLWAQLDPLQTLLTVPRLGPERSRLQYPIRTLLDSGAHVSFGSDWPVSDYRPLAGIAVAVCRQTPGGQPSGGWIPQERLTLDQAIAAYTTGSAYQAFAERSFGTLTPGACADLVSVDTDLDDTPPQSLPDVTVTGTWLAGERVH